MDTAGTYAARAGVPHIQGMGSRRRLASAGLAVIALCNLTERFQISTSKAKCDFMGSTMPIDDLWQPAGWFACKGRSFLYIFVQANSSDTKLILRLTGAYSASRRSREIGQELELEPQ